MRQLLLLLSMPLLIAAAPVTITKTAVTVSDPTGQLLPKAIPGALIDYTITVSNPLANAFTTVKTVKFQDAIPARTKLRVADLGLLNSGPIVFSESLLPSSGLSYSFLGFSRSDDSVSFSADNGGTWNYVPTPDVEGCDANITHIRIRLNGNQTAGSSFSVRFRVKLK